jgi:hypothetical protein
MRPAELLTIFVHMPTINNSIENEACWQLTLNELSATIKKKSPLQKVLLQGDWNCD